MNSEAGFCTASGRSVPEDPRGARHWGTSSCHRLVCGRVFDPDHDAVMRIGGEAPGGGPILSVGIRCQVRIRHPATSDRQFGSRAESQRERRMVLSAMLVPVSPFQDAGRKTTPSSGSPAVTKRQSAMISLRASATIMVLRVPLRLSAVRARYHTASALSF
jgi:hypothetical protein